MSKFAELQALLKKKKASLKTAGRTIKPKPGSNRYVLLGGWRENDPQFWHDFGQHYIKDEADQLQAVYICASETFGRSCAVCDGLAEANRTIGVSNPEVAELTKKAKANLNYLVGVLALDSDQPDTPQVLILGKNAFDQLLAVSIEWGEQVFDETNPQIVSIERTGTTQLDTKYQVQATSKRHTYKSAVKPVNLDEFVQQESEEAERKALLAIRTVSGASGAPRLAGSSDRPSLSKPKPVVAATDADFEDIPDSVTMAPAKTATTAPVVPALSEDIDGLLADLDLS